MKTIASFALNALSLLCLLVVPPAAVAAISAEEEVNTAVFIPEGELFLAPLAGPEEPRTHLSWLSMDIDAGTFNVASVGFGESFGLVRWPAPEGGWQLGISGGVSAQFNLDSDSYDLINADYVIGLPLSYQRGSWGARARLYHQSSHLGDEFLLYPQPVEPERINLSYEALELLLAWKGERFRFIAGPTLILHTDTPLERRSLQTAAEYESAPIGRSRARFFAALHLNTWEETDWSVDTAGKVGINIRKSAFRERALQFYAEGYAGHLPFGQFYTLYGKYLGLGVSFGF